jgi:Tfp pilus assembly protein PilF
LSIGEEYESDETYFHNYIICEDDCQLVVWAPNADAHPRAPRAYLTLGSLYLRALKLKEAEEAFQQVLLIAPDNRDAHAGLASVYHLTGDPKRAASEWEKAGGKKRYLGSGGG